MHLLVFLYKVHRFGKYCSARVIKNCSDTIETLFSTYNKINDDLVKLFDHKKHTPQQEKIYKEIMDRDSAFKVIIDDKLTKAKESRDLIEIAHLKALPVETGNLLISSIKDLFGLPGRAGSPSRAEISKLLEEREVTVKNIDRQTNAIIDEINKYPSNATNKHPSNATNNSPSDYIDNLPKEYNPMDDLGDD